MTAPLTLDRDASRRARSLARGTICRRQADGRRRHLGPQAVQPGAARTLADRGLYRSQGRSGRPRAVRRRRFRAAAVESDADARDQGRRTPAKISASSAESRFLYGAPASGLTGEGTAKITRDYNPYPAVQGIRIRPRRRHVRRRRCADDRAGDRRAGRHRPRPARSATSPTRRCRLKASVTISIHEPGGRTTDKSVEIPVRNHDVLIGIRADFDYGSVAENARAGFEAIAVNGDGKRIALSNRHLFLGARRHHLSVVPAGRLLEVPGGDPRPADHQRARSSIGAGLPGQAGAASALRLVPADDHRSGVGHGVVLPLLLRLGREFRRRSPRPNSGRCRQAELQGRRRPRTSISSRPRTARRWSWWRAIACSPRS